MRWLSERERRFVERPAEEPEVIEIVMAGGSPHGTRLGPRARRRATDHRHRGGFGNGFRPARPGWCRRCDRRARGAAAHGTARGRLDAFSIAGTCWAAPDEQQLSAAFRSVAAGAQPSPAIRRATGLEGSAMKDSLVIFEQAESARGACAVLTRGLLRAWRARGGRVADRRGASRRSRVIARDRSAGARAAHRRGSRRRSWPSVAMDAGARAARHLARIRSLRRRARHTEPTGPHYGGRLRSECRQRFPCARSHDHGCQCEPAVARSPEQSRVPARTRSEPRTGASPG